MTHLPLIDSARCSDCGGGCCKNQPGASSPEEWGAPDRDVMVAKLRAAFATDKWAIDWWEGNPLDSDAEYMAAYFVRPAHRGRPGMHASWGGGPDCAFLTSKGCELEHDARPLGCRGLKPGYPHKRCLPEYGDKRAMSIAWIPYHDVLEKAGLLG